MSVNDPSHNGESVDENGSDSTSRDGPTGEYGDDIDTVSYERDGDDVLLFIADDEPAEAVDPEPIEDQDIPAILTDTFFHVYTESDTIVYCSKNNGNGGENYE